MDMRLYITTTLLFFGFSLQAQFTHRVESYPDSAAVYLNDELQGYTPCKVKYYWRENIDGVITIRVSEEGYKDWDKKISAKPSDFDDRDLVYLDPKYPLVEKDELPLIAFDKLVVRFQEGRKIGEKKLLKKPSEDLEWKGSIKVGDDTFSEKFIEVATNMGLNTLLKAYTELFSEEIDQENQLPRFIIGVELVDMNIRSFEVKAKPIYSPIITHSTLSFKWSVLDKKSGKVVFTHTNSSTYKFRQERYQNMYNVQYVYENALIDFLSNEKFMALLEGAENIPVPAVSKDSSQKIGIESPQPMVFANFSGMVKSATKSCVTIITDGGYGSGAMVDSDGIILSAYHVVEGVNKIEVKFSSGIQIPATIIAYHEKSDVVLLKVNGSGFSALPLYTKAEYGLGEEVSTIGTPAELELGQSLSKGIISGQRKLDDRVFIQMDMAVSPGNSGGPLLNEKGEIIGVVLSKIVDEGVEGIGFAVPADVLIKDLNIELK